MSTPAHDPCPKCGNSPNRLQWYKAGVYGGVRMDERLLHGCTCCSFSWATTPLDAQSKAATIGTAPTGLRGLTA